MLGGGFSLEEAGCLMFDSVKTCWWMVEIRCLVDVVQNIGFDRSTPGFICCACMDRNGLAT